MKWNEMLAMIISPETYYIIKANEESKKKAATAAAKKKPKGDGRRGVKNAHKYF